MNQINLLPWRENSRRIKKMRFTTGLCISIFVALFILFIFHMNIQNVASSQEEINGVLVNNINQEHIAVDELNHQLETKNLTTEQLKFIIDIHKSNYQSVRLLNELVSLVPNTIALSKIKKQNAKVTLVGQAKTDDDVTQFMNAIGTRPYFNEPVLSSINVEVKNKQDEKVFELTFEQKDG